MKCTYCQSEMKQYNYSSPKNIWMCHEHYHLKPIVRADHYYDDTTLELYQIKLVVWKHPAQFPYDISINLINKTIQLFHLSDAPVVKDYNNEYEWAKCLERINQKDKPLLTDKIPENINPDTVNQYLDRYIKLLSFS